MEPGRVHSGFDARATLSFGELHVKRDGGDEAYARSREAYWTLMHSMRRASAERRRRLEDTKWYDPGHAKDLQTRTMAMARIYFAAGVPPRS